MKNLNNSSTENSEALSLLPMSVLEERYSEEYVLFNQNVAEIRRYKTECKSAREFAESVIFHSKQMEKYEKAIELKQSDNKS